MRRILLFSSLLVVLFTGCNKSDNGDSQPTTYRIDGINDVTIANGSFGSNTYLSLNVSSTGKLQETVKLSIEGLPGGVEAEFGTESGIPTFTTYLSFTSSSGTPSGKYPVKLVCTGSVTGRKSYTFNVIVPDCSASLKGIYNYCSDNCASGGSSQYYSENITSDPNIAGRILISNFENTGATIYADIDCSTQRLTIPSQISNGMTFYGTGSSNSNYISINYTKTASGINYNCSSYLER